MAHTLTLAGAGLLGSRLADLAQSRGWVVRILHRVAEPAHEVRVDKRGREHAHWNPSRGRVPAEGLVGSDAVVCLNGAAIAPRPWTVSRRKVLESSRLDSVNTLVEGISALPPEQRSEVFLSGSAIGYYGSQGDTILDESGSAGEGFLADLCQRWEQAALGLDESGVRVCLSRAALVVAAEGGIGAILHHLYRWGGGAQLGDGKQWQSYISLSDAARALLWVVEHQTISGAFNLACQNPLQNCDFHEFLSQAYGFSAFLKLPAFGINLAGDMGKELLLASQRVAPKKLIDSGFQFKQDSVSEIWKAVYGVGK